MRHGRPYHATMPLSIYLGPTKGRLQLSKDVLNDPLEKEAAEWNTVKVLVFSSFTIHIQIFSDFKLCWPVSLYPRP